MQFFVYIYKTVRVMRVSGLSSRAKYFLFFNINALKNSMFKYYPNRNPQVIQNNPQTPPNNPQTHQESGSSDATERLNRVTFCCLVVVCGSAILTRKVSCMWLCVHQLRRNGVFRFNGTGMTNMIAPSPENGFSCFGKMDT